MTRLDSIEQAIADIAAGKAIVVVDDEDRENEGDLIIPGQMATPDAINFMATHGRGLICVALTEQRLHKQQRGEHRAQAQRARGGVRRSVNAFSRRRRMCVSTVRVSITLSYSHTSLSNWSRDCTRPRRWARITPPCLASWASMPRRSRG